MAHGTPRINVCHKCKHYITVGRFSRDPICPDCTNESEQSSKEDIIERYKLGIFYNWTSSTINWTKLT